jgi:hypothetical protein
MSEEATFKMLKGLTEEEALSIHFQVCMEMYQEIQADPTKIDAGIPVGLIRDRLDPLLKPYGWSYDKLLKESFISKIS